MYVICDVSDNVLRMENHEFVCWVQQFRHLTPDPDPEEDTRFPTSIFDLCLDEVHACS